MSVSNLQQGMIRDAVLARLERGLIKLPLLPQVASKLLQMTAANRANAEQFAEVVHQDQILAGYVLKVVNSATFARKVPIKSLKQAVTLLGISFLKDVAVACALGTKVFKLPGYNDQITIMWRHALATANFAHEIDHLAKSSDNSTYLCGLLHEIGRPLALKSICETAEEVGIRPEPEMMAELVDEVHLAFGQLILEKWNLPEWVGACIEHHAAPAHETQFSYEVQVTHAACLCSQLLIEEERADELQDLPIFQKLGLGEAQLQTLLTKVDKVQAILAEAAY